MNPLLDPNKNFWGRHPRLKGIGAKFLPWLAPAPIISATIALLSYFEIKIAINRLSVAIILGISAAIYMIVRIVVYIQSLRRKLSELEKGNIRKDKEIVFKDNIIKCLVYLLPVPQQNDFNEVSLLARLIDPENPENFEFIFKTLWKYKKGKRAS